MYEKLDLLPTIRKEGMIGEECFKLVPVKLLTGDDNYIFPIYERVTCNPTHVSKDLSAASAVILIRSR